MQTIEQAIKSRFRNEKHKAIVNLLYTAKFIESKIDCFIKKYDLTHQQFNILRIVRGAGEKPVTLKYIKERMLDKMSDASRIVDKLYNKELLKRVECPNDRRSVDITITQKGLDLLEDIDKHAPDMDAVIKELSDADLKKLNTLLDTLRAEE
jgi:DNA-binding MarR family transcriptional regulator